MSKSIMEVFLTNIYGKSVSFIVDERCTVLQLKNSYAKEFETNFFNWYLMFNGKFLQNEHLLCEYNIQDGSIIHVTYRLAHRMVNPVELHIIYPESKENADQVFKRPLSSTSSTGSSHSGSNFTNSSLSIEEKPNQRMLLLYAEGNWTIGRVKKEFAKIRNIPDWKNYKFFANGICLKEKYSLEDYHIRNEATLLLEPASSPSPKTGIISFKRYISKKYFQMKHS